MWNFCHCWWFTQKTVLFSVLKILSAHLTMSSARNLEKEPVDPSESLGYQELYKIKISRGRGRPDNQRRFAPIERSQLPGGGQVVPINRREDGSQQNSGTALRKREDLQIESRSLKEGERRQQYNEVVQSGRKQRTFFFICLFWLAHVFIEVVVVFWFQIHFN